MPRIDLAKVPVFAGTTYPEEPAGPCEGRHGLRLRPGDCAGFEASVKDGHHLQNRSTAPARLLVVGSRDDADHGEYSDIDMKFLPGRYSGGGGYRRKDGSKFE